MNDILKLSAMDAARMIKEKKISSCELTRLCLDRIDECKTLGNFISICEGSAMQKAKQVDKMLASGERLGRFAGVPIGLKDNISLKGVRNTCASKFLENYVPMFDASVVTALKNEDAVILGKLNMDEFAMGSSSETSYFGPVRNFHNPERVSGGSSGGSANSVASGECFFSLGTDTGGSIRQPASFCGVVGLKPTYSSVSRYGVVAFASSLDQVGCATRTVEDSANVLNTLSFYDKKDSCSYEKNRPNFADFKRDIRGLRVGIAKEFFSGALNGVIKAQIDKTIKHLESLGAVVVETSFESFEAALATYYVISSAEAASNLARFDGIKYGFRESADDYIDLYYKSRTSGFGDEVKRRIMIGNYVLSSGYYDAYYLKASKIRTLIKAQFERCFEVCDALICPTSPNTAFKIGDGSCGGTDVYLGDIYTVPVNIAGLPAISVPCGKDGDGMPIGVQFISRAYDEMTLLAFGHAVEKMNG